jgi:cytoskeleton protein RodZ
MPLPDRGKPGATILVVALIVAACGYATWYYLASGERGRPERVAEVPAQLLPPPAPAPEPAPAAASPTGETASAPDGAPASTPGTVAPGTAATEPTPSSAFAAALPGGATSTPAMPTAPVTPAAPVTSTAPAAPGSGEQTSSSGAPVAGVPAVPPSSSSAPPSPPQVAMAPGGAVPAVPDVPEASPAPEAPRVYGVTNGPARIVIKAVNESWIQVRDRDNVVSVRTLKPGESYRVPDRSGLILRTGNAGGLEVSVDGRPVPPVGPPGKSRNVALDPDRLVAGKAAE